MHIGVWLQNPKKRNSLKEINVAVRTTKNTELTTCYYTVVKLIRYEEFQGQQ